MDYLDYYDDYLCSKASTIVGEYIDSQFINNIGIGVSIFFFTLFSTIVIGRSLGRAITWTGVGSIDKTFGLFLDYLKVMLYQCVYFQYLIGFILIIIGVYQ